MSEEFVVHEGSDVEPAWVRLEISDDGKTAILEVDCECTACKGTGLYVGMAERDGAAVVCGQCDGRGWRTLKSVHKRADGCPRVREGVTWVYETNPGICIGTGGNRYEFSDFGGMSYEEYREQGGVFPPGREMRRFACPCWWFQAVDSSKIPFWAECNAALKFLDCRRFRDKHKCWERWDKERAG